MKSLFRYSFVLSAVVIVFHFNALSASAAKFNGLIDGLEFAAQTADHGALFAFNFRGTVDGQRRSGIGIIEVFHTTLGDKKGDTSDILGGSGVIYIGDQQFPIAVDATDGSIVLVNLNNPQIFDDDYEVTLSAVISGDGYDDPHVAEVLLSHKRPVPTIKGTIMSLESP